MRFLKILAMVVAGLVVIFLWFAAYVVGQDTGYSEGYDTGHTEGYEEGYPVGYTIQVIPKDMIKAILWAMMLVTPKAMIQATPGAMMLVMRKHSGWGKFLEIPPTRK